jgi:hypothetical protein
MNRDGEIWRRLTTSLTAAARQCIGCRAVAGLSAEDVAQEILLNLMRPSGSGRRLVEQNRDSILEGDLPLPLGMEVRRRVFEILARQANRKSLSLEQVADRSVDALWETEGAVEVFVSRLPNELRCAVRARADGASVGSVALIAGKKDRTIRHWFKQIRHDAIAAGLKPA